MNLAELLETLQSRQVRLSRAGDQLSVDAPAGAVTPSIAEAIRENKERLLTLLSDAEDAPAALEPLARAAADDPRLSLTQRRIWALDQFSQGSDEFNLPGSWWLKGPMDTDRLAEAITEFGRRHQLLGRRFVTEDGEPGLGPPGGAGVDLRRHALADTGAEGPDDPRLGQWLTEVSREPFDLENQPLLRVFLVHCSPDLRLMLVVSHSAVWDAWCYDIFLTELPRIYTALSNATALPEPEHRYVDFVHWQQSRQDSPVVQKAVDRALDRLQGEAMKRARLSVDRQPEGPRDHQGARHNFKTPEGLQNQVRAFARAQGVTPFTVWLAAWSSLLGRLARRSALVLTVPLRGRDRAEFEQIIGPCTNNLFLPVSVAGHSFESLIDALKQDFGSVMGQEVPPFERLLEALEHDLAQSSLFQLQFSYQNIENRDVAWQDGIQMSAGPAQDFHATHADLSFWLREFQDFIDGAIDYSTALFEPETIEGILELYFRLVPAAIADPERPLDSLELRSEAEIRRFTAISQGPAPAVTRPWDESLLDTMESRGVDAHVIGVDRAWGSQALSARAGAIQAQLQSSGHAPGTTLQVTSRDPLDWLLGCVAVLFSGFDLAFEHDDAAVFEPGALAEDSATTRLKLLGRGGIRLADHRFDPADLDEALATLGARFADGSRILWSPGDPSAAVLMNWLAALARGRLVIADARSLASEFRIEQLLAAQKPDVVCLPPELLAGLLAVNPGPALRQVYLELAPGVSRIMEAIDSAAESLVPLVSGALGPGLTGRVAGHQVLLDQPEPGVSVDVVTSDGRSTCWGLDGQLIVSRPASASLPPLTAARRRDGVMAWKDRPTDGPDKVAGAVARELAELSCIADAHVRHMNGRTLAWICQVPRQEQSNTQIRASLRAQPGPLVLIGVDALPRDAQGRVIERELPDPFSRLEQRAFEPPAPGPESEFAAIWQRVIGVERVSAHDVFSELGGTSIQALVILAEARKLNLNFQPRLLFFQSLRQIVTQGQPSDQHSGQKPARHVALSAKQDAAA